MKLFTILRRYTSTRVLVLAMVLGAVSGACSTGLIIVINETLFRYNAYQWNPLVWAFAGLCVVLPVARYSSSMILVVLGARASYDLRVGLCRRILAAPLRRLEEMGSHRLMVALTDDVRSITGAFTDIPMLVVNFAVVLGGLGYMAYLSWKALLVVLAFMAAGIATYQIALRLGIRRQELARHVEDELFEHFKGVTQGTKELKMRRPRRRAFIGHLEGTAGSFRDLHISAMKIFLLAANWGNLLFFIVIGLLLYPIVRFADMAPEQIGGFVLMLLYTLTPLQMVLNSLPMLTQADVSVRKIESLGISLAARGEEPVDGEQAAEPPADWGKLELLGVCHTYHREEEDESFTLGPIDLTLEPGRVTFLTGGNGSGKTTLAKVLLGLYLPEAGEIRFAGETVTAETLEDYRQSFSTVFSDFFLFERLLGLESPELEEEARRYLTRLHLKHKVRVVDGRFSTVDLSQGQRKRLALLNAFLEDRPIFVFDEWAADQDPEFKEVFYYQILPELKARGKAVLAISHDDRYYHVADQLVKLEYGKIRSWTRGAEGGGPKVAVAAPAEGGERAVSGL